MIRSCLKIKQTTISTNKFSKDTTPTYKNYLYFYTVAINIQNENVKTFSLSKRTFLDIDLAREISHLHFANHKILLKLETTKICEKVSHVLGSKGLLLLQQ